MIKERTWPSMRVRVSPELREKLNVAAALEKRRIGQFCRVGLNAYADFIIGKHENFKQDVQSEASNAAEVSKGAVAPAQNAPRRRGKRGDGNVFPFALHPLQRPSGSVSADGSRGDRD